MLLSHHDEQNGERLVSCIQVSALSYGSWVSFHNQLDTQNAKALMGQCFDAGVNFFDNAEVLRMTASKCRGIICCRQTSDHAHISTSKVSG